jgi:hypothetical protein
MSESREKPKDGREIEALLAASLWLFGFVVAPLWHVASHGALAAHVHDGHRIVADDGAHCHGSACHAHDEGDPSRLRGLHGAHSLLHGGVAAESPLPSTPPVPVAAVAEARYELRPPSAPPTREQHPACARGPPA